MTTNWALVKGVLKKNPNKKYLSKLDKREVTYLYKGSIEGVIIETWWVDLERELLIDFAYDVYEIDSTYSYMPLHLVRMNHFEKHGVPVIPQAIHSYILPPSCFHRNGVILPRNYRVK